MTASAAATTRRRREGRALHYNAAMPDRADERPDDVQDSPMTWTYAAVLLVQVVVLLALWAAARYFGPP